MEKTNIYEKPHLPRILKDVGLTVLAVLLLLGLIALKHRGGPFLNAVTDVAAALALLVVLVESWLKVRRFAHNHILQRPAVMLDSTSLHVYTPLRNDYTAIGWDEIDLFFCSRSRGRRFVFPLYKDKSRNRRSLFYTLFPILRTDCLFYGRLEIGENELLDELMKRIGKDGNRKH